MQIRPGIVSKDSQGKFSCTPLYSRVVSLNAEQSPLEYAVPGGLIGTRLIQSNSIRTTITLPGA